MTLLSFLCEEHRVGNIIRKQNVNCNKYYQRHVVMRIHLIQVYNIRIIHVIIFKRHTRCRAIRSHTPHWRDFIKLKRHIFNYTVYIIIRRISVCKFIPKHELMRYL